MIIIEEDLSLKNPWNNTRLSIPSFLSTTTTPASNNLHCPPWFNLQTDINRPQLLHHSWTPTGVFVFSPVLKQIC